MNVHFTNALCWLRYSQKVPLFSLDRFLSLCNPTRLSSFGNQQCQKNLSYLCKTFHLTKIMTMLKSYHQLKWHDCSKTWSTRNCNVNSYDLKSFKQTVPYEKCVPLWLTTLYSCVYIYIVKWGKFHTLVFLFPLG